MHLGKMEIIAILTLVGLISTTIIVISFWRILKKAGFKPGYSFLAVVPIINWIALYYFAFSDWPSQNTQNKTEWYSSLAKSIRQPPNQSLKPRNWLSAILARAKTSTRIILQRSTTFTNTVVHTRRVTFVTFTSPRLSSVR